MRGIYADEWLGTLVKVRLRETYLIFFSYLRTGGRD